MYVNVNPMGIGNIEILRMFLMVDDWSSPESSRRHPLRNPSLLINNTDDVNNGNCNMAN